MIFHSNWQNAAVYFYNQAWNYLGEQIHKQPKAVKRNPLAKRNVIHNEVVFYEK